VEGFLGVRADDGNGHPQFGVEPQCCHLEVEEQHGTLQHRLGRTEARHLVSQDDMQVALEKCPLWVLSFTQSNHYNQLFPARRQSA